MLACKLFILLLGYYSGKMYEQLKHDLNMTQHHGRVTCKLRGS